MIFWLAGSIGTMFSGFLQAAAYTNLHGVHGRAGCEFHISLLIDSLNFHETTISTVSELEEGRTGLTDSCRAMAIHHRRNYHATPRPCRLYFLPQPAPGWQEDMVDHREGAHYVREENGRYRTCRQTALDQGKGPKDSFQLAHLYPS